MNNGRLFTNTSVTNINKDELILRVNELLSKCSKLEQSENLSGV